MASAKLPRRNLLYFEQDATLRKWEPLCRKLANQIMRSNSMSRFVEFDDAVQEARMFLLDAAALYDPQLGGEITYYTRYIWGKLRSWLREQGNIHVPSYLTDRSHVVSNRRDELAGLASIALSVCQPPPVPTLGDDSSSWAGSDRGGPTVEDEDLASVRAAVDRLPPRLRFIVHERFGMRGRIATLKSLGIDLGLTMERVRRLQEMAVRMLREDLDGSVSA